MELRRSPRKRTLLQGRVVFNSRFSLIECTVRDLSDTGAQIAFQHPVELPPEVELETPKKERSSRAKVVWSQGKNHGLMFLDLEDQAAVIPPPQPPDLSGLEIQNILDDARNRIAQISGGPADKVKLKLEIDF